MTKDDYAQYLNQISVPIYSLFDKVPADKLEWSPAGAKFMPLGALLRHLAACPGLISVIAKNQFPDAETLKKLIADNDNLRATPAEAQALLKQTLAQALADIAALSDEDYKNKMVSAPFATLPMWRMLLAGSEHLLNHKMQLYMYLKILGKPVGWMDLLKK
jgi:uncharacterized damage-inducible protein DinB